MIKRPRKVSKSSVLILDRFEKALSRVIARRRSVLKRLAK